MALRGGVLSRRPRGKRHPHGDLYHRLLNFCGRGREGVERPVLRGQPGNKAEDAMRSEGAGLLSICTVLKRPTRGGPGAGSHTGAKWEVCEPGGRIMATSGADICANTLR